MHYRMVHYSAQGKMDHPTHVSDRPFFPMRHTIPTSVSLWQQYRNNTYEKNFLLYR